jgi:hypothetical protein
VVLPSSYVGAGIVEGQWFLELRSQEGGSGVATLELQTVRFPRPKAPASTRHQFGNRGGASSTVLGAAWSSGKGGVGHGRCPLRLRGRGLRAPGQDRRRPAGGPRPEPRKGQAGQPRHSSGRPAQFQGIMVCEPDSLRGALGAATGRPLSSKNVVRPELRGMQVLARRSPGENQC